MDALLFVVIMVAALALAAVVIARAQRAPSPDDPVDPEPGGRPSGGPATPEDRDR